MNRTISQINQHRLDAFRRALRMIEVGDAERMKSPFVQAMWKADLLDRQIKLIEARPLVAHSYPNVDRNTFDFNHLNRQVGPAWPMGGMDMMDNIVDFLRAFGLFRLALGGPHYKLMAKTIERNLVSIRLMPVLQAYVDCNSPAWSRTIEAAINQAKAQHLLGEIGTYPRFEPNPRLNNLNALPYIGMEVTYLFLSQMAMAIDEPFDKYWPLPFRAIEQNFVHIRPNIKPITFKSREWDI